MVNPFPSKKRGQSAQPVFRLRVSMLCITSTFNHSIFSFLCLIIAVVSLTNDTFYTNTLLLMHRSITREKLNEKCIEMK